MQQVETERASHPEPIQASGVPPRELKRESLAKDLSARLDRIQSEFDALREQLGQLARGAA